MKLSKLAQVYDRLQQSTREPKRVEILADLFRKADEKTLEALAHFTVGEVVDPQLTDKLGIGPGKIRAALRGPAGRLAVPGGAASRVGQDSCGTAAAERRDAGDRGDGC